jgi:formiminotetrahydrofolate cyclodeaminase
MPLVESKEERQARYKRLAIAAAAAAARAPMAGVRTAYLLLAESWSNLAKSDDEPDSPAPARPQASNEPSTRDHDEYRRPDA